MKILHLCLACFYYDHCEYQENMLPYFHNKMGHDILIIASTQNLNLETGEIYSTKPMNYINELGLKLIRLERKGVGFFKKYLGLYKKIEEYAPDIIFIHGCQSRDCKTVVLYKKNYPNTVIYADNHADKINSVSGWKSYVVHRTIIKYYIKQIEPYVVKFFGVTKGRCSFLKEMYNISEEKIELLVMGGNDEKIDLTRKFNIRMQIREKLKLSEKDFVVISGGKIDKRKNIHLLIQSFIEIQRKNSKTYLVLFGSIDDDVKYMIKEMSHKNIIYLNWIPADSVYDYFMAADLGVFPGTHSVLWEQACATGLPCIFKYWEGIEHVNVGGNCIFLYEDNLLKIQKEIEKIIKNKKVYDEMKKSAIEKATIKFSYLEIAKKTIGV